MLTIMGVTEKEINGLCEAVPVLIELIRELSEDQISNDFDKSLCGFEVMAKTIREAKKNYVDPFFSIVNS